MMALIRGCRAVLRPRIAEPLVWHCLTFKLGGNLFGIDTRMVNRIVRYGIPAVPHDKPVCVRGFLRHEGDMIPILDIAARYGHHPLEPGRRTCLVVVGLGHGKWRRDVGVMVDEVSSVAELKPGDVRPVPEDAHRIMRVGIVAGMVRQEKDYLIVLDAMRLLSDNELKELSAYVWQAWPQDGMSRLTSAMAKR